MLVIAAPTHVFTNNGLCVTLISEHCGEESWTGTKRFFRWVGESGQGHVCLGVRGRRTRDTGVRGIRTGGTGVRGTMTEGTGVRGIRREGTGVRGTMIGAQWCHVQAMWYYGPNPVKKKKLSSRTDTPFGFSILHTTTKKKRNTGFNYSHHLNPQQRNEHTETNKTETDPTIS